MDIRKMISAMASKANLADNSDKVLARFEAQKAIAFRDGNISAADSTLEVFGAKLAISDRFDNQTPAFVCTEKIRPELFQAFKVAATIIESALKEENARLRRDADAIQVTGLTVEG